MEWEEVYREKWQQTEMANRYDELDKEWDEVEEV
jgi:hypothetical protein